MHEHQDFCCILHHHIFTVSHARHVTDEPSLLVGHAHLYSIIPVYPLSFMFCVYYRDSLHCKYK